MPFTDNVQESFHGSWSCWSNILSSASTSISISNPPFFVADLVRERLEQAFYRAEMLSARSSRTAQREKKTFFLLSVVSNDMVKKSATVEFYVPAGQKKHKDLLNNNSPELRVSFISAQASSITTQDARVSRQRQRPGQP